jgi:hypothetical protein
MIKNQMLIEKENIKQKSEVIQVKNDHDAPLLKNAAGY